MHSSDLFLFGTKKAVWDIWSSNWNLVFTCFNFEGWLYVVKFQESSRIRIRRLLKPRKKNIPRSFLFNLIPNVATFTIFSFYTLLILLDWNDCFVGSNFHLLQVMPITCFCWQDSSFKFVIYVLPQATSYVAMDIWMV